MKTKSYGEKILLEPLPRFRKDTKMVMWNQISRQLSSLGLHFFSCYGDLHSNRARLCT